MKPAGYLLCGQGGGGRYLLCLWAAPRSTYRASDSEMLNPNMYLVLTLLKSYLFVK